MPFPDRPRELAAADKAFLLYPRWFAGKVEVFDAFPEDLVSHQPFAPQYPWVYPLPRLSFNCKRSAIMAMNSELVGLPLAEFTV